MNARCAAAGLPVAAQAAPSDWAECEAFLALLATGSAVRAVLKPRRGQASVGVHLVRGWAEAQAVFEGLSAFPVSTDATEFGSACVVQEALSGREWVVDTVSRDGRHKALALWRYDKGEANGAAFVYFGAEPMGLASADAQGVHEYALGVLDALSWRWGPAHLEIMCTPEGPRLVEINAGRWNGLDFKLLADLCYGVNAYDATVAAYLDPAAFDALPDAPPAQLACCGMLAVLCSYVAGRLERLRAEILDDFQALVALETAVNDGDFIQRTIDLDTAAGYAHLIHADASVVHEEYGRLQREMPQLFELQPDT
jgi:biotin carboxylase